MAVSLAHAQTVVGIWTNRFNTGTAYDANAWRLAVDPNGDVVVAGSAVRGVSRAYATIKYSNSGAALWTNYYNGPANGPDNATAVAVDRNGNVFVTGNSFAHPMFDYDIATVAYSSAGVALWTNRAPASTAYDEEPVAIAVDSNGDVLVTGYSTPTNTSIAGSDYVTVKLSGTNGAVRWTKYFSRGAGTFDQPRAVAVDAKGDVIVTGRSQVLTPSRSYCATIKYAGTNGTAIWTNYYDLNYYYNGPKYPGGPAALALDVNGNALVAGCMVSRFGDLDYLTIKYSGTNGAQLWSQFYWWSGGGTSFVGEDRATAVAVGANGKVYVTGYSLATGTGLDYATLAYSGTNGAQLWERRYVGPGGDDHPLALAVAPNGNVIVTGGSVALGGTNDFTTIAYTGTTGTPVWTNRYNGPGNGDDYAVAMAVDGRGNAVVTGSSTGSSGKYDFATIKYGAVPVPITVVSARVTSGVFTAAFTNTPGASFTAFATTNPALGLSNWTSLGPVTETAPGQFQFSDARAGTAPRRFYRVRCP